MGVVAIGNPELRRKLTEQLRYNCITPAILVHPAAYVSPSAQLQKGCCIEPNATVQAGTKIPCNSVFCQEEGLGLEGHNF